MGGAKCNRTYNFNKRFATRRVIFGQNLDPVIMTSVFENFSDNARLWVYASNRPINLEEHEYIHARLSNFIDDWHAHGSKLEASYAVLNRRFILIAVNEGPASASGCSIDKCLHEIQDIDKSLGLDFLNRLKVVYRDESNNLVVSCSIPELKEMIEDHDFPNNTPVFNLNASTLGELRNNWEIPAKESWIKRYLNPVSA